MPTPAGRLKPYLQLVRLPNVLTAPADVAMGMAVGGAEFTPRHLALLLASAFAYAGGMALNDAVDAQLDAIERPERPIPSGRVTRSGAFALAGVCLALCLAVAAVAGPVPFAVACLLVLAIVVYDGAAKGRAVGPASMAACRALDAGLGIAAGAVTWRSIGPAALLFAYVLVLSIVSRFEVSAAPTGLVRGATAAFAALFVASAAFLVAAWGLAGLSGAVFLGLLAAWLGGPLRAAAADPVPRRIIPVIKAAVLGIILLDAAFTGAARGLSVGLAVALLFVPAYLLGRAFASA